MSLSLDVQALLDQGKNAVRLAQYAEAGQYYQQAVDMAEAEKGEMQPLLVTALTASGELEQTQGQYEKAPV